MLMNEHTGTGGIGKSTASVCARVCTCVRVTASVCLCVCALLYDNKCYIYYTRSCTHAGTGGPLGIGKPTASVCVCAYVRVCVRLYDNKCYITHAHVHTLMYSRRHWRPARHWKAERHCERNSH